MKVEIYRNINEIQELWQKEFIANNCMTPYQSFECNKFYFDRFYFAPSRMRLKPIFYVVGDDENNKIIIPLIKKGKDLYDFCSFSSLDYWDVVTPPHHAFLCITNIEKLLDFFFNAMLDKGYSFKLARVNEDSLIYQYFKSRVFLEIGEKCGKIFFSSYEAWYLSLSKHMKQNLRTAYNKLSKAKITVQLKVFDKTNWLENSFKKDLKRIYERRWQQKNRTRFNFCKKILRRCSNPVNKLLECYTERYLFVLCLNEKVGAFCSCIFRNKILYIPRLAVDYVNFKNYDVGSLLISELLKFNDKNHLFNVIDLTRGGEPYKFKLGAITHFNYKCVINR